MLVSDARSSRYVQECNARVEYITTTRILGFSITTGINVDAGLSMESICCSKLHLLLDEAAAIPLLDDDEEFRPFMGADRTK